jgi:hypothetical protein
MGGILRQSYLGAAPKAKVLQAVREAVSPGAARKLGGLRKSAPVPRLNGSWRAGIIEPAVMFLKPCRVMISL